jgi:hypothetical protein
MGGSLREKLDHLEQKIKFALRPLVNAINVSGMNRERKLELDELLLEISTLQQTLQEEVKEQGSTESKIRMAGLEDHLYALIKGTGLEVYLPERRQYPRSNLSPTDSSENTTVTKSPGVRIVNVSEGGIRLRASNPISIGSVVRAELKSPGQAAILLRGEVIWARKDGKGDGYIVGVHFLPMEEEDTAALKRYLEDRSK